MDERRDRRRLVAWVAEHVGVDGAVEALEELARRRLLHEQSRARHAVLAGVVVLERRLLGGRVEIGVREHEERALAAELGGEGHEVPRRRGRHQPPVSDEPVKLTRRRRPSATSVAPASSPIPWTTLKTPGGMPASSVRSARSEHESGAHSGGLRTTAHPAASAGAVFQVESMNGAFQGVITATGPAGMRRTRFRVPFELQSRGS